MHSFTPPNMHQQRNTFSNKSMIMYSFLKLALFAHTTPGQEIQLQARSFHCWKPHSVDVNHVFIWYIIKLLKAVLRFPKAPQPVPASLCKWRFYFRAQMFQKLTGLKDLYMWYLSHFYRENSSPVPMSRTPASPPPQQCTVSAFKILVSEMAEQLFT